MRLRFLLIVVIAFMLAACSGAGEEPDTVGEAQETLEPAATAAASAVATLLPEEATLACESLPEVTTEGEDGMTVPEGAVAVFERTGGIAGVMETTIVYADGRIENVHNNETFEAPPQTIAVLVNTAEDAGFFDLNRDYVPDDYCCDFFNYSLTIRDCDQVNTVIAADEAPGTPAQLWDIIDTVETLVAATSAAAPLEDQ